MMLFSVVAVLMTIAWIWEISLPTGELPAWDRLMFVGFVVMVGLLLLTLLRFLTLWSRLSGLLNEILKVPMVSAYERLPDSVRRLFRGYISFDKDIHHAHLETLARCLPKTERNWLATQIWVTDPKMAWLFGEKPIVELPNHPAEARSRTRANDSDFRRQRRELMKKFHQCAVDFLESLPELWSTNTVDQAFGADAPLADQAKVDDSKKEHERERLVEKENFVAAYVAVSVIGFFAQLQMLVVAMIFSAPLLLFTAASYPFQPERPRLYCLVALLVAVSVSIAYVLVRINCHGFVSRVARTTPNLFTPGFDFFQSISVYVLPVIAIALLQLLGLFRVILEPVLELFG